MSSPLDLDDEAMEKAAEMPWILVAEDHGARTGLAASVAEWLASRGIGVPVIAHGVTGYQSSGASDDLLSRAGLDAVGIITRVRALLA